MFICEIVLLASTVERFARFTIEFTIYDDAVVSNAKKYLILKSTWLTIVLV